MPRTVRNNPKAGPRRPAPINKDTFEEACRIQCTLPEICALLGVSATTLRKWAKTEYGCKLGEAMEKFACHGTASLRRAMWKKAIADEDGQMQKWLSKNTRLAFAEKHELGRIETADEEEIRRLLPMALEVLGAGDEEKDEESDS